MVMCSSCRLLPQSIHTYRGAPSILGRFPPPRASSFSKAGLKLSRRLWTPLPGSPTSPTTTQTTPVNSTCSRWVCCLIPSTMQRLRLTRSRSSSPLHQQMNQILMGTSTPLTPIGPLLRTWGNQEPRPLHRGITTTRGSKDRRGRSLTFRQGCMLKGSKSSSLISMQNRMSTSSKSSPLMSTQRCVHKSSTSCRDRDIKAKGRDQLQRGSQEVWIQKLQVIRGRTVHHKVQTMWLVGR
mmetsp:Transcript_7469/g.12923  ORF Transcript_7469/g.12923 Transcript_7469/m.12923 type:complete len:238 (-) Transcript_7469:594-1307(-)